MRPDWQACVLVYLGLTMAAIVAAAIYTAWRDRAMAWKITVPRLCRCGDCGLTFVAGRGELAANCPRCQKTVLVRRRG